MWVSIDGAQKDSFGGVRTGAGFVDVIGRLQRLSELNASARHPIEVGIAFVAMRSNIVDLPDVLTLAERLNAKKVSVSNVLPYTAEMEEYSEKNQEDCTGNKFPTCGGCIWAQGVIQCP
ncbi:MAG: hypothetical protein WD024_00830 [Bacillota bacterium]